MGQISKVLWVAVLGLFPLAVMTHVLTRMPVS